MKRSKEVKNAIENLVDVQDSLIRILVRKKFVTLQELRDEGLNWVADLIAEEI